MATAVEGLPEAFNVSLEDKVTDVGIREEEDVPSATEQKTHRDDATATVEEHPTNGKSFKVMVAVDPTQWSYFAFDWYIKNAHQPNSEVICYHAMDKPAVHGDEFCVSVEAHDAVMKGCESNAQDLHDDFTKKMKEHKMNGRVVVQFSVIGYGQSICEAAVKENINLLVVGTRGKGAIRRTLTGSVSDYVLRHAHCPVIVCCQDRPRRRSSRLSSSNSIDENVN